MTHEYVLALGGRVLGGAPSIDGSPAPTAIAWAADRVLAVGTDDAVRAISRGDSIVLDLDGCLVTPLPDDPARAEEIVRGALGAAVLAPGAILATGETLEPGSPADLACWREEPDAVGAAGPGTPRLVAVVRAGAFTEGDPHRGPFAPPTS